MLWYRIAQKEIRLKTFRFRKHRKEFFVIIYGLFFFWAAFLGPYFMDLLLPDILKIYSSFLATILHPIIEYSFLMIFLIFIIYPLLMLYRKLEIGVKDIILSSPAKAGDIFLGEFIGQLPFYSLIVLAIGPLISSFLIQINPDLTLFHHMLFYLLIFILIIFALLIGNVIANWLEYKLLSSDRKSSLNSVFFATLPFIIILALYISHFIFELLYVYPAFKILTNFFPSFWFSNIILYFVDPSSVSGYFLNIWVYILLIIGIPLLITFISYKRTESVYELEKSIKTRGFMIKLESSFIRFINLVTPSRYKVLVITQFREFVRKRESISKMIYLIALNIVFGIFLSLSVDIPLSSITRLDPVFAPFSIEVSEFNFSLILILAWMVAFTFGIFMGIYVFVNTKEITLLYKKSIRNVKALVISFLYNMLIICLILGLIFTIFFSIIFLLDFLSAISFYLSFITISMIILTQAVAIQCIRPLYEERGKFIYFNIYIITLLQVLSFIISLLLFIFPTPFINYTIGLNFILIIYIGISSIIALLLLFIGILRLNRTE
ncbi:MAG: hypothetical protein EU531_01840 [Promethearchaeota archaeon]|nr:MAG: hypothetical protein EU531_01840 [Candidatus Lokiarchaeota archaeon]